MDIGGTKTGAGSCIAIKGSSTTVVVSKYNYFVNNISERKACVMQGVSKLTDIGSIFDGKIFE